MARRDLCITMSAERGNDGKPVISAWMPKSSVQGWQTLVYYIAQMKHLYSRQVTVHGLDTGIHATAELVYNDERSSVGTIKKPWMNLGILIAVGKPV